MLYSAVEYGQIPAERECVMELMNLLDYLTACTDEMVDLLTRFVEMESPTTDKEAVDRFGAALAAEFRAVGGTVEVLRQPQAGDHLRVTWGEGEKQLLLLGHMDTVWPMGTVRERPVRIEDGRLYGPGAHDMKGGLVIALFALRALGHLGLTPPRRVVILCNSDEEMGTHTSRAIIEEEALRSEAVLVLEPPIGPQGILKTWRKGVGIFTITAYGRAAHAGGNHEQGVNAIEELARHVLYLQGLTDYRRGITVNVGLISGGSRSNVVPERAEAVVDIRVMTIEEGERMEKLIRSLQPHHPLARLEIKGGFNRPPMVRTPAIVALFRQAQALAQELGFHVDEGGTGGGSDGNFTAALDVPTLDGLGAVGDGAHALHEHVVIAELPRRAALLAALLLRLQVED